MRRELTFEEKFFLERFKFAAQTISEWQRDFPQDAERMVSKNLGTWSTADTNDAFKTAYGG